ncbi:hypothetical protein CDAR_483561 [Caerostris darwini]|uniref:Uncharacterized protein n=1 Tax=Caerostris darwini TaxID=1538125 RepID=A0AAV4TQT4_9ARAC|nr:hypothetical protein CDAR_483561 [Caerostris darwini]
MGKRLTCSVQASNGTPWQRIDIHNICIVGESDNADKETTLRDPKNPSEIIQKATKMNKYLKGIESKANDLDNDNFINIDEQRVYVERQNNDDCVDCLPPGDLKLKNYRYG